jgi:hypothetical protein
MQAFNGNLYIASLSGKIFEYTGSATSTSYSSMIPVMKLRMDGGLLYAAVDEGGYYLTFNGSEWNVVLT